MIINKYQGPSWSGAELVRGRVCRGRVGQGPSCLVPAFGQCPIIGNLSLHAAIRLFRHSSQVWFVCVDVLWPS